MWSLWLLKLPLQQFSVPLLPIVQAVPYLFTEKQPPELIATRDQLCQWMVACLMCSMKSCSIIGDNLLPLPSVRFPIFWGQNRESALCWVIEIREIPLPAHFATILLSNLWLWMRQKKKIHTKHDSRPLTPLPGNILWWSSIPLAANLGVEQMNSLRATLITAVQPQTRR